MTTTTATASTVSRVLTAAGIHKSALNGFQAAAVSEGTVRVVWNRPSGYRGPVSPEEGNRQLTRATAALESKGYTVETRTYASGLNYLIVTKG